MKSFQTDLSVYRKFNFERAPVGVKFLSVRPEGIEQLDTTMALCEMINEAQKRKTAFYIDKDNEEYKQTESSQICDAFLGSST